MRFVNAQVAEQPVVILVQGLTQGEGVPVNLAVGDPDDVTQRMFAGEAVVGTVLAQRCGLKVGGEVELTTNAGVRRVRIAGLANEYLVGGLVLHMEREAARRLFDVGGVDVFMIKAYPVDRAAVEARLRELTQRHGLMLHSFAELSGQLDAMLNGVVGSLWGLLVLGFIVAGFGIANTLTMNVLEQTRELAPAAGRGDDAPAGGQDGAGSSPRRGPDRHCHRVLRGGGDRLGDQPHHAAVARLPCRLHLARRSGVRLFPAGLGDRPDRRLDPGPRATDSTCWKR